MNKLIAFLKYAGVFLLVLVAISNGYRYVSEQIHKEALVHHVAVNFTDVYAHHGDFVKNVPFHPGDHLFVHYIIDRRVTCLVTIQFRLTKVRQGDIYTGDASYSYPLQFYYGPPAKLENNEYFEIPLGMPAGKYELRRINFIDCDTARWAESSPSAPLTIE